MKLTNEQIEYINEEEQSVLCACPGSGKTTALAYKYKKIIESWDSKFSGVALLSFTNIAADEIKEKINKISNNSSIISYPHFVGTIDSFFDYIAVRFGKYLVNNNIRIILENSQKLYGKLLNKKQCYECNNRSREAYFNIYGDFVIKKETLECPHNDYLCKDITLNLVQRGILTQDNVPFFLNALFNKFTAIIDLIVKRYPRILLDEAQDTSSDQMYILDILSQHGAKIDYIGDPDQSIFEWRNANPKLLIEKINDTTWKQHCFVINNRCTQILCDATKRFGNTLSKKKEYLSNSPYKDLFIKPILYIYKNENKDKSKEIFLEHCRKNNIKIDNNNVAVVMHSLKQKYKFDDVVKDDFTYYYGYATYYFYIGDRRSGYNFLKTALCCLLNNSIIETKENSIYGIYDKHLDDLVDSFQKTLVDIKLPIYEWKKKVQKNIECDFAIKDFLEIRVDEVIKIKTRINGLKSQEFNKIRLIDFFELHDNNVCLSTIHGVKGKTFDALMLHINASSNAKTIKLSDLLSEDKSSEKCRDIFVAMTRPRKLLFLSIPYKDKINLESMFPKDIWNYIYEE